MSVPVEQAKTEMSLYEQEKAQGLRRPDGSLNLKQLKPVHMKMIEMHLNGTKNAEIARALNKTQATISRWLSDPLVVGVLEQAYKAEDARFKALYSKVVDVIEDGLNMNKHSIGVNLKAADKYLKAHDKYDKARNSDTETAEDVIARVFNQLNVNGNVQINIDKSGDKS